MGVHQTEAPSHQSGGFPLKLSGVARSSQSSGVTKGANDQDGSLQTDANDSALYDELNTFTALVGGSGDVGNGLSIYEDDDDEEDDQDESERHPARKRTMTDRSSFLDISSQRIRSIRRHEGNDNDLSSSFVSQISLDEHGQSSLLHEISVDNDVENVNDISAISDRSEEVISDAED